MANRSWFSSKKGGPATFTQAAGFLNEKDDELLVAIYDRKIFKGEVFLSMVAWYVRIVFKYWMICEKVVIRKNSIRRKCSPGTGEALSKYTMKKSRCLKSPTLNITRFKMDDALFVDVLRIPCICQSIRNRRMRLAVFVGAYLPAGTKHIQNRHVGAR